MINREAAAYWMPAIAGMTIWVKLAILAVIASAAKQSIFLRAASWIASQRSQ